MHADPLPPLPPAGPGPDGTAPALELSGVTRHFTSGGQTVRAVNGIDLRIGRGEVVALLGPNGAGKTTLLDMVIGLSEPTAGSLRVLGERPRAVAASGRISAVLQTGGLLSDLSVRETVEVIASFHRAGPRVAEVMRRADLEGIAGRRVGKCSGGEQQRVKFALALLPDPDVLVLDEPTAGMDVVARRHFWDTMREDADAGRTVVFATHYLEEAEQFARRTVIVNHGVVVADGLTSTLRASLGGRTLAATLPRSPEAAHALVAELRGDARCASVSVDGARVTVHAAESDAVAAHLLAAGASELEIAAPTLESAFAALTEA